jgi:hypothetical protein
MARVSKLLTGRAHLVNRFSPGGLNIDDEEMEELPGNNAEEQTRMTEPSHALRRNEAQHKGDVHVSHRASTS